MKIATDYVNDDKIDTFAGQNGTTTTVTTNLPTGERYRRTQKIDGTVKEKILPDVKPKQ